MTSVPPPQVWLSIRAVRARELIRFLVDVVGFSETAVFGEGDVVDHAQLDWPLGGGVMLGSVRDNSDAWPQSPGQSAAYVVTDDADALFARVVASGAEILKSLQDTDHGGRDFTFRDPEGNLWSFGTYRGEPKKD